MVAFPPVSTNEHHERWLDLAERFMSVLREIREYSKYHDVPADFPYPEVMAALKALHVRWNVAIRKILASHEGAPMSPEQVLRELGDFKPVKGKVNLQAVRSYLTTGVRKGLWHRALGEPAKYTTQDPDGPPLPGSPFATPDAGSRMRKSGMA